MAAQSQAARVVLISGAVMGAIIAAQGLRNPTAGKTYKRLWAAGILTLALAAAADFAPGVIVPFSVAVVVAFTLKNQGALGSILSGQAAKEHSPVGPGGPSGPVGGAGQPNP